MTNVRLLFGQMSLYYIYQTVINTIYYHWITVRIYVVNLGPGKKSLEASPSLYRGVHCWEVSREFSLYLLLKKWILQKKSKFEKSSPWKPTLLLWKYHNFIVETLSEKQLKCSKLSNLGSKRWPKWTEYKTKLSYIVLLLDNVLVPWFFFY